MRTAEFGQPVVVDLGHRKLIAGVRRVAHEQTHARIDHLAADAVEVLVFQARIRVPAARTGVLVMKVGDLRNVHAARLEVDHRPLEGQRPGLEALDDHAVAEPVERLDARRPLAPPRIHARQPQVARLDHVRVGGQQRSLVGGFGHVRFLLVQTGSKCVGRSHSQVSPHRRPPPSTTSVSPVMNLPAGLARYTQASATSNTSPSTRMGLAL